MTRNLHAFFTFLICIVLDWLWMTGFAGGLLIYQAQNWFGPADLLFYCVLTAGLLMFSIYPALSVRDRNIALYYGALFGLAIHGLYGLFNAAWYGYWPTTLFVADTLWGTFAGTMTGLLGFELGRWLRMSGSASKDVAIDGGKSLE